MFRDLEYFPNISMRNQKDVVKIHFNTFGIKSYV